MFVYDQATAHEAVLAQYIDMLAQAQKELAVARAQIAQLEGALKQSQEVQDVRSDES